MNKTKSKLYITEKIFEYLGYIIIAWSVLGCIYGSYIKHNLAFLLFGIISPLTAGGLIFLLIAGRILRKLKANGEIESITKWPLRIAYIVIAIFIIGLISFIFEVKSGGT